MGAAPRGVLFLAAVSAILMAIAAVNAADGEAAASVVVGLAKCAECTRKNMKAEEAFKGLQVVIKCMNSNGEYESKASGELESTGEFSIPLAADLRRGDCFAQLHSAASSAPCTGQQPSKIVPLSSEKSTFVAVAGEVHRPSTECASAFLCHPIKKHFFHFFHKKPVPPKPDPKPDTPNPKPEPSPKSGNAPPSPSPPSYGGH